MIFCPGDETLEDYNALIHNLNLTAINLLLPAMILKRVRAESGHELNMVGTDHNGAGIYDWQHQAPSSTTSNSLSEELRSKSFMDFSADNGNVWSSWTSQVQNFSVSTRIEEKTVAGISFSDVSMQPKSFGAPGFSRHGGFAESLPARQEFNLAKLDTAPIPPASMASFSDMNSQCSRNPPLPDPTTLMDLESPVLLYKSMTPLSPITGEFQGAGNTSSSPKFVSPLAAPIKSKDNFLEDLLEAVACKPPTESYSRLSGAESKATSIEADNYYFQSPQDFLRQANFCFPSEKVGISFNDRGAESPTRNNQSPAANDQQLIESDPRGQLSAAVGTQAEDGYSWRKYGQKQVKGSIHPRSYYKCTHTNCQAKKKVERSLEGDITEIVYMGDHNHPIPHQNSRSSPLLHQLSDPSVDGSEQPSLQAFLDGNTVKGISQNMSGSPDWSGDYLEATSSLPVAAEYGDASKTLQHNLVGVCLSSDAISNDGEEDDRPIHQSISPGCDGEGDEPESKRSKISACASEMSAASRAHREPKVVFQAFSEADILEDGYRWRKYGQKIVKGNPNPRSYYKCTSPGCKVRKHIERDSKDPTSVLTTYEGIHNHDVPAARSSIHPNSTTISVTHARQPNSLLQRPETTQDSFMMFDGSANPRTFGFPGREHLGLTAPSLPFAMRQINSMNHPIVGLGPMAPREMPVVPPLHSYLKRLHPTKAGLMMPRVESEEEHFPGPQLHMPNANPTYGQFMNWLR